MPKLTKPGKTGAVLALAAVLVLGAAVGTWRDRDHIEMSSDGDHDVMQEGVAGSSGGGGSSRGRAAPDVAPRIIRTAVLQVKVGEDELAGVEERVTAAAEGTGGFVHESSRNDRTLALTLRVPARDFDTVLARIRRVGDVRKQSVKGRDVSEEYVDLEGRLRHWQAQEAVYLRLLSNAGTIPESLEVQRELSKVQETIEQLEGRRRYLDDRTNLATINARFVTPGAAPDAKAESRLSEAWANAKSTALDVVAGTLVVTGALVPLALIGGVFFGVWMLLRRRRPALTT